MRGLIWILLLLAAGDLFRGISLPGLSSTSLLLAIVSSLFLLNRFGWISPGHRRVHAWLLGTSAVLILLALYSHGVEDRLERDRPARIASIRARDRARIESAWTRLLGELETVGEKFSATPITPVEAEQRGYYFLEKLLDSLSLPAGRTGLALYIEDELVAWAGNSSAYPFDLPLAEPAPDYRIETRWSTTRLLARYPGPRPDLHLLLEVVLQDPAEPDPGAAIFRFLKTNPILPATTFMIDLPREITEGKRAEPALAGEEFLLTSPEGKRLVLVSWGIPTPGTLSARARRLAHNSGAVVLVLLFCGLFLRELRERRAGTLSPGRGHAWARLLFLSLLLWAVRGSLLLWELPDWIFSGSLFGPQGYATLTLKPLLRSPIDLFLTSAAFLGQAMLILDFQRRSTSSSRILKKGVARFRWTLAILGTLLILYLSGRFCFQVPFHTDWDLLRLQLLHIGWGHLAVILALSLISLTALTLIRAIWSSIFTEPKGSWHWLRRYPAGTLILLGVLMTLLSFPLLAEGYRQTRVRFLENTLRSQILEQEEFRRQTILQARDQISRSSLPCRVIPDEPNVGLAYEIWSRTELAVRGYDSQVALFDSSGRLIDRFELGLSTQKSIPPSDDPHDHGGIGEEDVLGARIIHAQSPLHCDGNEVGFAEIHIHNVMENIPILSSRLALSPRFLTTSGSGLPGFLNGLLVNRVTDREGHNRFATQEGLPPPSSRAQHLFVSATDTTIWETVRTEDDSIRLLSFPYGNHLWSIGYRTQGLLGNSAAFIRFLILNFLVASLVFLPGLAVANRKSIWRELARFRFFSNLGRSYYRKLFLTFLAGSLIPLLLLSLFLNRLVSRQAEQELQKQALATLGAARRVMGEHLANVFKEKGVSENELQNHLNDEELVWLGWMVQGSLSFFLNGDLVATSNPFLYDSGILPPLLPGRSYQEIFREARSISRSRQSIGGEDFLLMSAPMWAEGWPDLVVSVLLPARQNEAGGRAQKLTEAVLVTSTLLIATLGLIGLFLARRISLPIRRLSEAARRISTGEFDERVAWKSEDETGVLVDSFNQMAESLHRQRENLRRRRDYIEAILANVTTGVISVTDTGRLATINPAAQKLFDLVETPVVGIDFSKFLESQSHLRGLWKFLAPSGDEAGIREERIILREHSEESLHLRVVRIPLRPQGRIESPGWIFLFEDVTKTVRSSRLEAWAEMARGIAHEIKNPLTPILLSAEHIRSVRKDRDPDYEKVLDDCLDTIVDQVRELRQISREFSDYARLPDLHREWTRIPDYLEKVISPYRSASTAGVQVSLECEGDVPDLFLDRKVIRRALVNLVENALQAMPAGGRLTVRARKDPADPATVWISVVDTGEGIDPEQIQRLFEPYFSTKETGTGIGLAVTRSAVQEHGGRVEVTSHPGRGTTMTLILPVGGNRENG
ncbi:MAG: ATP-binding protein [Acidobacteriota bacterium]